MIGLSVRWVCVCVCVLCVCMCVCVLCSTVLAIQKQQGSTPHETGRCRLFVWPCRPSPAQPPPPPTARILYSCSIASPPPHLPQSQCPDPAGQTKPLYLWTASHLRLWPSSCQRSIPPPPTRAGHHPHHPEARKPKGPTTWTVPQAHCTFQSCHPSIRPSMQRLEAPKADLPRQPHLSACLPACQPGPGRLRAPWSHRSQAGRLGGGWGQRISQSERGRQAAAGRCVGRVGRVHKRVSLRAGAPVAAVATVGCVKQTCTLGTEFAVRLHPGEVQEHTAKQRRNGSSAFMCLHLPQTTHVAFPRSKQSYPRLRRGAPPAGPSATFPVWGGCQMWFVAGGGG